MKVSARFAFERETKGAVRFQEVNATGAVLDMTNGAVIGTLYLRKSALNGQVPKSLTVEIDVADAA